LLGFDIEITLPSEEEPEEVIELTLSIDDVQEASRDSAGVEADDESLC